MSLKAKLEAVIYAAEEPVTLAQLTALFAADALEWKAAKEAASADEAAEAATAEPLLNEEFPYLELDQASDVSTATVPDATPLELAAESVPAAGPESGSQAETEASPAPSAEAPSESGLSTTESEPSPESSPEPAAETTADAEAEAKRLARQRDREARAIIRQLLDELIASYASDNRGIEIREIAGGYRMATKPEWHDAVLSFIKRLKPPLKLSLPALETLAVIAYKQPVTAPEVNEIRGVDSTGVFGSLLARKLIATAGRKQVIGRPILYKTTREFLLRFGLKDVAELPSMEEFEKMAAIELDEPESASEGEAEPSPASSSETGPEFDENAAEPSTDESDPGAAPESAVPPEEQEKTVADMPATTPTQVPAETAVQNTAETPAETAADPPTATEVSVEAEAPEADPEPQSSTADEPAANEPANQAESTPA
jgi:segregation and condensation protein B